MDFRKVIFYVHPEILKMGDVIYQSKFPEISVLSHLLYHGIDCSRFQSKQFKQGNLLQVKLPDIKTKDYEIFEDKKWENDVYMEYFSFLFTDEAQNFFCDMKIKITHCIVDGNLMIMTIIMFIGINI